MELKEEKSSLKETVEILP